MLVLNNKILVETSKISFEEHQIILEGLNLPMEVGFQIEWFSDGYVPMSYTFPVIDCSIQNATITINECKAKGCEWKDSIDSTPPCYINPSKGGYTKSNASFNREFELVKKDDGFSLFKDIKSLKLQVTHATISNSMKRMTRIKVYIFLLNISCSNCKGLLYMGFLDLIVDFR